MKLKSLILGSSVAAISAVGAQAADAIVIAEPEPVEYVRVCDVYGAGFFYIPGTETCLRIGGEIRAQYGAASSSGLGLWTDSTAALAGAPLLYVPATLAGNPGISRVTHGNYNNLADDVFTAHARGRIYFDARSETEYGTLRGYARVDLSRTDGANAPTTNHAWLSLGGFRVGWTDSAWVSTPHGGLAAGGSHTDNGFFYGYHQTHLIQYNFSGSNGFFATLSLEHDNDQGDNYMPNVVGVVGINQGWGAAWVKVGFDEDIRSPYRTGAGLWTPAARVTESDTGESGFGVTAGLHYNIAAAPGSSFRLLGYYADSDNQYNPLNATGLSRWYAGLAPAGAMVNGVPVGGQVAVLGGPEWSLMASYHHQFNAQFGASIGVQYFSDFYVAGTDISTGLDGWALELAAVWQPVKDFVVRTEVIYSDFDTFADQNGQVDGSNVSGFVRFSRFF